MKVQAALLTFCLSLLAAAGPLGAFLERGRNSVRGDQERTGAFMLSVLRRDGIVVPFAAFDGRRWSKRWPERLPNERPISIEDIPKPWWGIEPAPHRLRHWADGAAAGNVTLTSPVVTPLMCEPRLALRSDYKSSQPAPPGFVLPSPKDGLLISGDATVSKIDTVDPASEEARKVLGQALEEFNREENASASAFTAWRHPVKSSERKKLPVTLEAIYRAPTDDPEWTAYFIEAVREYPPGPNDKDGCGLATYVSGFVLTNQQHDAIRISARITFCDRKDIAYMLPFGLIEADGKNYWVFQHAGFEAETYQVLRPHRRNVDTAVIYNAGGCGR